MKRAHKIALAPTPEQEVRFGQHAGYARFAYNWALGEFKAGLDVGEWLSDRTLRPRWNVVKKFIAPWGAELSQNAAKYAIIDLGQAATSWLDFTQKLKEATDAITLGLRHSRLASEGFSLSAANADVQELPATLCH